MTITSTNLAGIDVESLVTSLMTAEATPLTNLNSQKTKYQSQISALGTLKSALSTFQTAAQALSTTAKFNAQSASSSDSSVFTISSDGSAAVSNYAVTVNQIATSQKLSSGTFANTTDVVGTGTLTIAFGTYNATGNSFTANANKSNLSITIDSSNNTLAGVRDAINGANGSVTASIVNDGTSNRLVLTSKDTGLENSLKITVADTGDSNNTDASGLSQLAFDPTVTVTAPATTAAGRNMTQLQAAQNALLTVDGISVSKASNTITDVISGATLTLLKSSTTAQTATVAVDKTKVTSNITAFVNAYNSLNTSLKSLTKYDSAGKGAANGVLLGDATTRGIATQIKTALINPVSSNTSLTTLSQIGVSFQSDGSLALDSTKLSSALDSNYSQVASLFTSSTDGYATKLNTLLTSMLSTTGSIQTKTDGINSSIKRIDNQTDNLNIRLAAIEARYRAQFTAMNTTLTQLQSTSTALTQQLASIKANS
jgi:flagellar hook-associated protein 2